MTHNQKSTTKNTYLMLALLLLFLLLLDSIRNAPFMSFQGFDCNHFNGSRRGSNLKSKDEGPVKSQDYSQPPNPRLYNPTNANYKEMKSVRLLNEVVHTLRTTTPMVDAVNFGNNLRAPCVLYANTHGLLEQVSRRSTEK